MTPGKFSTLSICELDTYPSGLVAHEGDEERGELIAADIEGACTGDSNEAVGTGLPHAPHSVLTQTVELGQLHTKKYAPSINTNGFIQLSLAHFSLVSHNPAFPQGQHFKYAQTCPVKVKQARGPFHSDSTSLYTAYYLVNKSFSYICWHCLTGIYEEF